MQPRISVLTLGVDDLNRALVFYRDGLGWVTEGVVGTEFEHGKVVFFHLQPGLILALYARSDLAWDAGVQQSAPSPTELSIGHAVGSEAEVDKVMAAAVQAGAKLIKPSQPTFWGGYAGYFADPDGHLWEVVFNPVLRLPD
ncbi:VOC family protein [Comamonas guangdongensis]|uniref:VOC family protein n=1 Tax=Comamonas guangdongensis TaxID=510515 RepID=A0ABV3ZV42_9BURK